ncbi:leucyl/phenylalanyl-tRNA--protein transferase [bacterium]|nr:leucyl/phenylalanyl-tRNA--protein transferase [Verrucomicrobiales bacterium]MDB4507817.1 leucyl/phenylalanyl-tRNA--protein transferase [bacterium]MDF1786094.1 leucyl/phenylalanyl-tRNA--protein transferase [Verrucomicrobiales bacterium]
MISRNETEKIDTPIIEPAFLLQAYGQGLFPMGMDDGEIGWFSPDPRGIFPLDAFHVPHGLKRFLKKSPFEIRFNTRFRDVMIGCADREPTWIDDTVLESYCRLHDLGFAHSVETWEGEKLVGGLYGVSLGAAFFGESMFSRVSNASSAALVALVDHLNLCGFMLLDTQWTTPHLKRFGALELPRAAYLRQLERAVEMNVSFRNS